MSLQAFLKDRWCQSGLKKNENILLHSSFKRTFNDLKQEGYKFNPEDILDSLLDLVTPDGTLVLPTFNFDFNTIKKYDYYNTKSQMGIVTELARQRSDFTRTLNPVYSFAVYGKYKNYLCKLENKRGFGKNSPFDFFYKNNAKIITIGTPIKDGLTIVHYFEAKAKVEYRFHKYFKSNYIDIKGESSIRNYSIYVKYLKAKKPDYTKSFWEYLEKQNFCKENQHFTCVSKI